MNLNNYTFCGKYGKRVLIDNTEPIEVSCRRICIFCLAKKLKEERKKMKE